MCQICSSFARRLAALSMDPRRMMDIMFRVRIYFIFLPA